MAKSIMIDPGHGGTDPGAYAFGVQEKVWNLRISLYQYERLKELGARVGITRTSDVTLDSVPRTNQIRGKYDLCISNHWNAFNGSTRGVETIHSINSNGQFARDIANALVRVTGIPLRRVFTKRNGIGTDWYFMNRLTWPTDTVIIEYGFLDNVYDHNWYKNDANFYKAAEAVIEVICKHIGITYKAKGNISKPSVPAGKSSKLYKVQAGAFKKAENAEALHEKMELNGIDAFVLEENGLYKVQAGAYSMKENAETQLAKVTKVVGDGFIVETGATAPAPKPKKQTKLDAHLSFAQVVDKAEKGGYGNYPQRADNIHNRTNFSYQKVQAEINRRAGAKSAPKAKTLHLPSTASAWRVYRQNGPYTVGNEVGLLAPSRYGGLSYTILGNVAPHVYLIQTRDLGRVAIYAHPSTGATIK